MLVRLGKGQDRWALELPSIGPMISRGRPMPGWVRAQPQAFGDDALRRQAERSHGWARLGYAVALFSMFSIYVGMSTKSDIPPYYFFLHPLSTVLFVYTLLRSTFLTLARGGIVWRGTFYPLQELRKGMV